MLFTASVIDLSDDHRISNGTVRVVYEFPGQPDLFIKVFHSFDDRSSKRPIKRLAWTLFPTLRFRNILNELQCELLVSLKLGSDIKSMPISRMLGVVQTNRGPGVVVERINGLGGGLAPSLHQLSGGKTMTEPVLDALNAMVKKMFELQIVARDISFSNIVYGSRDAGPACFLIDGYGERNVVPLRSMSKRLNDRSLDRQFATIAQKNGSLAWDSDHRIFLNSH